MCFNLWQCIHIVEVYPSISFWYTVLHEIGCIAHIVMAHRLTSDNNANWGLSWILSIYGTSRGSRRFYALPFYSLWYISVRGSRVRDGFQGC